MSQPPKKPKPYHGRAIDRVNPRPPWVPKPDESGWWIPFMTSRNMTPQPPIPQTPSWDQDQRKFPPVDKKRVFDGLPTRPSSPARDAHGRRIDTIPRTPSPSGNRDDLRHERSGVAGRPHSPRLDPYQVLPNMRGFRPPLNHDHGPRIEDTGRGIGGLADADLYNRIAAYAANHPQAEHHGTDTTDPDWGQEEDDYGRQGIDPDWGKEEDDYGRQGIDPYWGQEEDDYGRQGIDPDWGQEEDDYGRQGIDPYWEQNFGAGDGYRYETPNRRLGRNPSGERKFGVPGGVQEPTPLHKQGGPPPSYPPEQRGRRSPLPDRCTPPVGQPPPAPYGVHQRRPQSPLRASTPPPGSRTPPLSKPTAPPRFNLNPTGQQRDQSRRRDRFSGAESTTASSTSSDPQGTTTEYYGGGRYVGTGATLHQPRFTPDPKHAQLIERGKRRDATPTIPLNNRIEQGRRPEEKRPTFAGRLSPRPPPEFMPPHVRKMFGLPQLPPPAKATGRAPSPNLRGYDQYRQPMYPAQGGRRHQQSGQQTGGTGYRTGGTGYLTGGTGHHTPSGNSRPPSRAGRSQPGGNAPRSPRP